MWVSWLTRGQLIDSEGHVCYFVALSQEAAMHSVCLSVYLSRTGHVLLRSGSQTVIWSQHYHKIFYLSMYGTMRTEQKWTTDNEFK